MPRHFGFSVLEDQQCAAALMWTCVTLVYLVPATILFYSLLARRGFLRVSRLGTIAIFVAVPFRRALREALGGCLEMATEPILAALDVSAVQAPSRLRVPVFCPTIGS